jgi:hypothetical protein
MEQSSKPFFERPYDLFEGHSFPDTNPDQVIGIANAMLLQ